MDALHLPVGALADGGCDSMVPYTGVLGMMEKRMETTIC